MIINKEKTKVMLFNNRKTYDFEPLLNLGSPQTLEVVDEIKLLGLIISSDLSWESNTSKMCQKAFTRMWMLRRLQGLGADQEDLLNTYKQQILSVIEFAVPVWAPGLTKIQANRIERVQKTAVRIILGDTYISYKKGLAKLKLQTLAQRREKLCVKFTTKATKHPRFNTWFCNNDSKKTHTRSKWNKYKSVLTRTRRYQKSPIPYLTEIANLLDWKFVYICY